jgi:hypothetical protein
MPHDRHHRPDNGWRTDLYLTGRSDFEHGRDRRQRVRAKEGPAAPAYACPIKRGHGQTATDDLSINQSTLSSLLVILRPKDCATQNRDNFSTPSHWRAFSGLRRNSSCLGTWHVSIVARPVLSRHIWEGRVSAQRSVMGASVAIMRALPLLGDLKGLA